MDFHYIQLDILKHISLNPGCSFSDLQSPQVDSNLTAYHIKKLINEGFVEKRDEMYYLAIKGKEIANVLDVRSEVPAIDKHPKISIKCYAFEGSDFNSRMIVHKRLKEPYFGNVGVVTGTIKYGQTIKETLHFEMKSKTGMDSEEIEYVGISNVINKIDDRIVEDKIFHVFTMFNLKGNFIEKAEGYENFWIETSEFPNIGPQYTGQLETFDEVIKGNKNIFLELKYNINKF